MKYVLLTGIGYAIALALVVGLTGCASSAQTAQAMVNTAVVTMPPSYRFDPVAIQVPVGTTVTWRNTDNFTHSVSVVGGGFQFLNLPPGKSGTLTFDKPGKYAYVCTYHAQNMRGVVNVVAR